MEYRKFSDTGWLVSEIGLGCWQIGGNWGTIDENESMEILHQAVDEGVNFFDTSDMYGDGRSEKYLGRLVKNISEKIYITTKLGRRWKNNYPKGYTHEYMEDYINRSLNNLGVECLDLLQLHCPPVEVCQSESTYEQLDKFVEEGKINYYGVSVHNLSDAFEAIKHNNVVSIQLVFNIFRQKPAELFFSEAKKKNIAIIARGPLASGLLTGLIDENTKFEKNDHRNYNINGEAFDIGDTFSGVKFKKGLKGVEKLKEFLPSGCKLSELSLKWILCHKEISVVIPGALKKDQVIVNSNAGKIDDISYLYPKIRSIYEKYIKFDVHNRW